MYKFLSLQALINGDIQCHMTCNLNQSFMFVDGAGMTSFVFRVLPGRLILSLLEDKGRRTKAECAAQMGVRCLVQGHFCHE